MKIKEYIKSKVDTLELDDLRLIEVLIESLSEKRKVRSRKKLDKSPVYLDIIRLLQPAGLTSKDIQVERDERL